MKLAKPRIDQIELFIVAYISAVSCGLIAAAALIVIISKGVF